MRASGGGTPVPLAAPFATGDASSRLRSPDSSASPFRESINRSAGQCLHEQLVTDAGLRLVSPRCDSRCPPVSSSSARSASALQRSRPPHATAPADRAVTVAALRGRTVATAAASL